VTVITTFDIAKLASLVLR